MRGVFSVGAEAYLPSLRGLATTTSERPPSEEEEVRAALPDASSGNVAFAGEGRDAAADYERYLLGTAVDYVEELGYWDRKRIHNLKYFTWIEQQGKELEDLNAQWYDRHFWNGIHTQVDEIDALIEAFNERTGLLEQL